MKIVSIHHSGFAIISERVIVIIDYYKDPNKVIPHLLKSGKSIYVLSTHRHHDHFNEEILGWSDECENIKFIFSNDIKRTFSSTSIDKLTKLWFLRRYEVFEDNNLKVQAFGSTDVGVSFYITLDNIKIFHAGDLNNWHWEKESTLEEIRKAEGDYLAILRDINKYTACFDVAMFPVDARMQGDYARGARQFVKQFKVDTFIPMHTWGQWEKACDYVTYKNDKFGKYVCLKEGESLSLDN